MARETWVQSQVESYQRLKKRYLIPPRLTLSIIRYGSSVKWSNRGKGVAPSPTSWCRSQWKGSHRVALNYSHQLYFIINFNQVGTIILFVRLVVRKILSQVLALQGPILTILSISVISNTEQIGRKDVYKVCVVCMLYND